MNEATRERLLELLDEYGRTAMRHEQLDTVASYAAMNTARLKIIRLFESMEPKEEP